MNVTAYDVGSSVWNSWVGAPPASTKRRMYSGFSSITMDNAHKEIYHVNFNQDSSSIAVCHESGYHLYNICGIENSNNRGLEAVHLSETPTKTASVERLFQSSLITIVSINHPRKLQVYHFQKRNEICSNSYNSSIKAVRMNRKRVVVCLEESIHVHNIRDMRLLHMIRDTPTNRDGLIDLCASETSCHLAYPGSTNQGHVNIFDADHLVATCTIAAHDAPLAALRFNMEGTKLATASVRGTVIRVFNIPGGERLYEFTRGVKRCVTISCLAFSIDSKYLCSSSNTETVHVFSLAKAEEQKVAGQQQGADENEQSLSAWTKYFTQQASNYLPQQMNELMLREKSFATARLPVIGTKTSCAMPRIGNRDYLAVASTDGYLFCYSLPTEPGECTLARQYRIGPLTEEEEKSGVDTRVIATGATAPIYPSVPQRAADDMAPITLSMTPPPNRSPPGAVPSSPTMGSPISASPSLASGVKPRKKTTSQCSTSATAAVPGVTGAASPQRAAPAPIATNNGKKKSQRKTSSSTSSDSDSIGQGSIASSNSADRVQKTIEHAHADIGNLDEFPPLGAFDD